jgi:uncharacterized protein (TIGR03435 family)
VGSPKWATTEIYDIVAKSPTPNPSLDIIRQMAQALLADRFNLVIRRESRDAPAYVLAIGKRPLQMQNGDGGRQQCNWSPTDDGLQRRECHNATMAEFARQMPGLAFVGIDLLVVDETNLDGVWDFHFEVGAPRRARTEERAAMGCGASSRSIPPNPRRAPMSLPRWIVSGCNWKKERRHCRCSWWNTPNRPAQIEGFARDRPYQ